MHRLGKVLSRTESTFLPRISLGNGCSSISIRQTILLGCTLEACGFRDSYASLNDRITIVGVSRDSVESHRKFADKFQLPFTLVSDPDRTIITAYGADGVIFPKRVTFIIDPRNIICKIYHGFDAKDHALGIGRDIDALGA